MQRRLMLAGALLHEPDFLIADEPTAEINPILRARIWENFRSSARPGENLAGHHAVCQRAAYCDQVAIMRKGCLVTVDTPKSLQHQAMDGEVIHMQMEPSQVVECMRFLRIYPGIQSGTRPRRTRWMYVFVEDAGKELPNLLAILREQRGITPAVAYRSTRLR